MRAIIISLAVLSITACKTGQQSSTSEVQSASSSKSLISKLQKIGCVKTVEQDGLMGTPEAPAQAGATSGNLIVMVRNVSQTAQCVKDIQKALPDVKILSELDNIGAILVLGDAKQASLADKVKKADCAKYMEAELLQNALDGNAPAKATGNYLIGVKDEVTLDACIAKLKANGITVLDTIKNLKVVLVKGN